MRRTAQQQRTARAIERWCSAHKRKVLSVSHIQPRAYVLAKLASQCLLVVAPRIDAEPQIRETTTGFYHVRVFDDTLQAGDWCSTAYVSTPQSGEPVAIPVVL